MLARAGRGIPVDLDQWAIEPKWDGWRCLARIENGAVRLTSRWRNDLKSLFSELRDLPPEIAHRKLLLDGEIVALRPDGSHDFHALTSRRRTPAGAKTGYVKRRAIVETLPRFVVR